MEKKWPVRRMALADLKPADYNPRTISEKGFAGLMASIARFGLVEPIIWNERTGNIVGGHQRYKVLTEKGVKDADVVVVDFDEKDEKALNVTLNNPHIQGEYSDGLKDLLSGLQDSIGDSFEGLRFDELVEELTPAAAPESFDSGELLLPFEFAKNSVLDAANGDWMGRKKKWKQLGIESDEGRDAECLPSIDSKRYGLKFKTGVSIFDPVLCELICRWYARKGAVALDPFAGGSVRGVVASWCGLKYFGIDLRPEQIEANQKQWGKIGIPKAGATSGGFVHDPEELTPVQQYGNIWIKRDDLFEIAGVRGGKVRTCSVLSQGASGLCTAGSRMSPQVNIVAHLAAKMGVPCRLHTPEGELSPEVKDAQDCGGEIIQHKAGYNSVIVKRAHDDAVKRGLTEIPFGMECEEAVRQTRKQVANLPACKRLVVPVGSGMSLSGILWGMKDNNLKIPVLGIRVGADPTERLDKFAPPDWREMVEIVQSEQDYHSRAPETTLCEVQLDPIYESKCLPYIQDGDCMWVVGIRATEAKKADAEYVEPTWLVGDSLELDKRPEVPEEVDFVFTCPPYEDLEVYSDNEKDLSTMSHEDFLKVYRAIIAKACAKLKENRFAAIVVGEVRGKDGAYRNFVGETVKAFTDCGMKFHQEALLVTSTGSLLIRVSRQFKAARKIGKTHQNVLVFVKGDAEKAAAFCAGLSEE